MKAPAALEAARVPVAPPASERGVAESGREYPRPPPPMASPTNAKRRSAQRDHATQHSAAVRMACGDCCYPACYVKERAGEAIAKDFDISMSGECVLVECSSARCDQAGRLHKV